MSFWPFGSKALSEKQVAPAQDPTSIGNICVKEGWITQAQLDKVMMKKNGTKLGEMLVALKLITNEQLRMALMKQQVDRGQMKPAVALEETIRIQDQMRERSNQSMREVVTTITHRKLVRAS